MGRVSMRQKIAMSVCCRNEDGGICKRGPKYCDYTDYLEMVDAALDELLSPTEDILSSGANAINCSEPVKSGMGAMYDSAATMWHAMVHSVKDGK